MKKLSILLAVLMCSAMAFAGSVSINLNDAGYTVVTNQYLSTDGVTFSNSLELTTGDGDIGTGMDYPLPPNGSNVITNDPADPMTLSMTGTFTGTGALAGNYVYSLSFYYTSPIGATVTAYNINGQVLTTLTLGANNGASTLATLTVPGCTGASWSAACTIAYVTFSDGGVPDTLTIGELTLTDAATPEPGTLVLLGSGILGLLGFGYRRKLNFKMAMPLFASALAFVVISSAVSQASDRIITQPVDENVRVTLAHSTRPEAIAKNDRGRVEDGFYLAHIMMQLRRSPDREEALDKYMAEQMDPKSPNFHKWLTASQFGERYGLEQDDISAITGWLQSHGFKVNVVYANRMVIDFSGTAGQVREAFQTELHNLVVNGEKHIAAMSDPKMPAAFGDAVIGLISLHDFKPHKMYRRHAKTQFTSGSGSFPYIVAPPDLETIYNINPLWKAGITGAGQTIVAIEDTDVYNFPGDWQSFRNYFGLSKYTATFTQIHPAPTAGGTACTDPSTNGDQDEAILDVEWMSAVAPSANIELASCRASGAFSFGGLLALQNLINDTTPPPSVISMSYGEGETASGAALIALFNSAFQQAATEGVSTFVSSGDANAAANDRNDDDATHGIAVTGWGESNYNVSVGGTDFQDGSQGTYSQYWNPYNSVFFGSAKSYIPEIPWNGTCASQVTATFFGFPTTYGASGFCNDTNVGTTLLSVFGGSGGPTACATGAAAATTPSRVVSGTCAGYPKPSWQSVLGNPNDGVRDLPDVSLFASNGIWGHYLVFCWSDVAEGGAPCTGDPVNWPGGGGTSFSSPIMAGIQALVNQKTAQSWGNPNPVYYQLAAAEYGNSGSAACNSSANGGPSASCVFYDVTVGDMNSPCTNNNCYLPSGTNGVMSSAPETLTALALTAGGTGYTSVPTCTFSSGGGSGATCSVTGLGPVATITLSAGGTGYTSTPTCTLSGGGGSGATCSVLADPISTGTVTNAGSGYTARPTCTITGTGTGATCRATESGGAITAITISTGGSGYSGTPTCTLGAPTSGTQATCSVTASTAATTATITSAGTGYSTNPTCAITGGGGGTGATCTATASATAVAGVTLGAVGSYQWLPLCTISGGGGTGAACVPSASNSATSYIPAYGTTTGWDFATGIGSVNAYNLVTQWSSVPAGQILRHNKP